MKDEDLGPVQAFCIAGRHGSTLVIGNTMDGSVLPPGWALVRARFSKTGDCWVEDPDSPASILACPDHLPLPATLEKDDDPAFPFKESWEAKQQRRAMLREAAIERAKRVHKARSMKGRRGFGQTNPRQDDPA